MPPPPINEAIDVRPHGLGVRVEGVVTGGSALGLSAANGRIGDGV